MFTYAKFSGPNTKKYFITWLIVNIVLTGLWVIGVLIPQLIYIFKMDSCTVENLLNPVGIILGWLVLSELIILVFTCIMYKIYYKKLKDSYYNDSYYNNSYYDINIVDDWDNDDIDDYEYVEEPDDCDDDTNNREDVEDTYIVDNEADESLDSSINK